MTKSNVHPLASYRLSTQEISYARKGWHVFPVYEITPEGECACLRDCGSPGKHPRTARGFHDATTNLDKIQAYREKTPNANVAIVPGPSCILVLDVDPRNGGDETLADIEKKHGQLPKTLTCNTGGGGQHYYFKRPEGWSNIASRVLGDGLELKADGSYIVAPPSNHLLGKYEWDVGQGDEPVDAPQWLQDLCEKSPGVAADAIDRDVLDGLLGKAFAASAMIGRKVGPGKAAVQCPWEHEHTGGKRFDSSTIVFAPSGDERTGWFHCSHAHCASRTIKDVLAALPQQAVDTAKAMVGLPIATASNLVSEENQNAEWLTNLTFDDKGNVRATAGNLTMLLCNLPEWKETLRVDRSKGKALWMKRPPPISGLPLPKLGTEIKDSDWTSVAQWFAKNKGVHFDKHAVMDSLATAALAQEFSSLEEWLETLEWDRKPRTENWLVNYLGATNNHVTQFMGNAWLISAVARAYKPGCKVDHILVLEGRQGCGKSQALRILGGDYFLENPPGIDSPEFARAINSAWIVELSELDSIRRVDSTRVKAMLSGQEDTFRPPYGRCVITQPRVCAFAGSTNEARYLSDPTGGRRFWPVRIKQCNFRALADDREQLIAEAVWRYKAKEAWWPQSEQLVSDLRERVKRRNEEHPWEEAIREYVKMKTKREKDYKFSGREVLGYLGVDLARQQPKDVRVVSDIMRGMGLLPTMKKVPGEPQATRAWMYPLKKR